MDLTLLSPSNHYASPDDEFNIQWRAGSEGASPSLSLVPKSRSKIKSFAQWETLFDIYHAIYVTNPHLMKESSSMLAYKKNIKRLHVKNADWRSFDESFRTLRLIKCWAWDAMPECLMWEAAFPTLPVNNNPTTDSPQASLPKGDGSRRPASKDRSQVNICWKFNALTESRCFEPESCRFKHVCETCLGNHPLSKCTSKTPNTAQGKASPGS